MSAPLRTRISANESPLPAKKCRLAAVIGSTIALVISGCGGADQDQVTVTETVSAPPASTSAVEANATAPSTLVETGGEVVEVAYRFQSQSGNIACSGVDIVGKSIMTCYVRDTGDWILYTPGQPALVDSKGDTPPAFRDEFQTLAYGESMIGGALICESSEVGIQCYSVDNVQDGFRIAREGVTLFPNTLLDSTSGGDAYAGEYVFSDAASGGAAEPDLGLDPQFATCSDAIDMGYGPYFLGSDPEYEWYRDSDSDGIVCE